VATAEVVMGEAEVVEMVVAEMVEVERAAEKAAAAMVVAWKGRVA